MTRIPRAKRLKSGLYLSKNRNDEMDLVEVCYNKLIREFWITDYPHCRVTDTITNDELKGTDSVKLYGPIRLK